MSRKRRSQSGRFREWLPLVVAIGGLFIAIISLFFQNVRLENRIEILEFENRILRDTKDRLFGFLSQQVMEGQVPIDQIISPFPLKEPGTKVDHLEILLPKNDSEVSAQFYVEGVTPDPEVNLWVIIHPTAVATYQVQPKVEVWKDCTWRTKVFMEKTEGINIGEPFEIMTVANPKVKLKEGDILSGWPEAEWKSQIIKLTRK
jgi:hypothetical protein